MTVPYMVFRYELASNGNTVIAADGAYYRLIEASGPVLVGTDQLEAQPLAVGIGVAVPGGFNQVRLVNPESAPVAVEFAIGAAEISDNRLHLDTGAAVPIAGAASILESPDITLPGGGAVAIVGARAGRRSVMIGNAGTVAIRIGGETVADGRGIVVDAGMTATIDTTAAVFGWAATATTVSVLEIVN